MGGTMKGQLLISAGGLYDPNFRHTVVLIGEHDSRGAVGVVLNRPSEIRVADAVPPLGELVGPADVIHEGGPVEPRQPVLLAELRRPDLVDVLAFGAVGFLTGDVDPALRENLVRARVFAGHAGWGAGQLEAEMDEGAWILEPATAADVFTNDPGTLWRRVLERKGPPYDRIARIPFDPSTN